VNTSELKLLPKILYIEDNSDALSLIGRLMRGRYFMFEAEEPIVGIQLAIEMQPDLILLDMNLPHMNSIEVAIQLRKILKPGTPIVALSADFEPGIYERALAAGFSGFMNKPIEIDAFYEQIDSYLARKPDESSNAVNPLRAYRDELIEQLKRASADSATLPGVSTSG
jgi:CheY-like chemotaxis protein